MHRACSQTSDSVRLAVTVRLLFPLLSQRSQQIAAFPYPGQMSLMPAHLLIGTLLLKLQGLYLISMKYPETTNTMTA